MNPWAFWSTVHYLWLVFQEQPLVVYLEGPGFYGAGIPCVVSLLILGWIFPKGLHPARAFRSFYPRMSGYRPYWMKRQTSEVSDEISASPLPGANPLQAASPLTWPLLSAFFLACVVIGHYSGYWTAVGYHFLDAGLLFWPMLAMLDADFPVLLAYPLTFFGLLIDDVFAAGQYGHWAGNFWFGVGGAGFHDGLFIGPVTTLALALFLRLFGTLGRRQGFFVSESSSTHTRPNI